MNPNDALKFAMQAGEIMLQSGAETFRVEDTIKHILINCDFNISESFVTTTGIFASITDEVSGNITMLKRVKSRTNNFEKIVMVNDVSRRFADGKITVEQGIAELSGLKDRPPYPVLVKTLASAFSTFAFTYIFGGGIGDCANAFFAGLILQLFMIQLEKMKVVNVLSVIIGSAVVTFISLTLLNFNIGSNLDCIIIGSIMQLLPGVAFTNAIRDILEGDYLSGTSRIMDAIIIAIAIAVGVGTVMKLWFTFFGGALI